MRLSMRYRSWALTRRRGGDDCSDLFRPFDKVRIGKVGVACRGAMPVVPEKPADELQTFARHNRLTCGGMAQVMQVQTARQQAARLYAPRPSARRGNGNGSGPTARGSAATCAREASPSATARGPVFESSRFSASAPTSRRRRLSTSLRRHPVSACSRLAATGLGPYRLAGVERASEPGQLVCVEEPLDMVARVLRYAEAGVGAARTIPTPWPGTSSRAVSPGRGWRCRAFRPWTRTSP